MPGRTKEVVVNAAMLAAVQAFAAEHMERFVPMAWWMRRRLRIEPLATARQVAIVLLGRAERWTKSTVARSFGRNPAVFHWAQRAVQDRVAADPAGFGARFSEAQRRFDESLKLMEGEGGRQ